VLAYAKIFMASAATSLSLAAVVIVGALGQTIRTTAGMSVGLDQFDDDCVVAGVIWPRAGGMRDDAGTVPPGASRPWGALLREPGPLGVRKVVGIARQSRDDPKDL
jgi:hypothetical protein